MAQHTRARPATGTLGAPSNTSIRPFRVVVPPAELEDLRDRLARTRWPDELPDVGWSYGVPLGYLKELVEYWRTAYDWRKHEARLNQFPQFTTTIDGALVHFLHVRFPEPDALPLIMTHGWPGSIVEFLDILGPLTDPRSHRADPTDGFHVVVPSLPGYGFSGPTGEPKWDVHRVAQAWAELMSRLGYRRYGAAGNDFGSMISRELGLLDPEDVVGIHVTQLMSFPSGNPSEVTDLTDEEKTRLDRLSRYRNEGLGYGMIQSTRPQTLAYGLTDSPVGQLAWIVEKFKEWTDAERLPEDVIDRDHILTNVMIYWVTGTAGSSARLYYENARSGGWSAPKAIVDTDWHRGLP